MTASHAVPIFREILSAASWITISDSTLFAYWAIALSKLLASRILYRSGECGKRASGLIPIRTLALGANFREHRFSRWPYVIAPQTGVVGYLDGTHIEFLSGRSARTISRSFAACATSRDLKCFREARSNATASRIAYSVERGTSFPFSSEPQPLRPYQGPP